MSSVSSVGAFVLAAVVMLGASACTTAPPADDATSTTTSPSTTTTSSSTGSEETETSTGSSMSEGDSFTTDEDPVTSGSFYAGPDVDVGSVSECDPFAQDCPEGEKCVAYGSTGGDWDANKCVQITGDGEAGEPCTWGGLFEATDSCDAFSYCWDIMDVDDMSIGTCTPSCTGVADDPVCAPATACLISNEGAITLCLDTCDPLLQDCNPGLACRWGGDTFQCIFDAGDIPTGEPCGFTNDCDLGLACIHAEDVPNCNGAACCNAYCDLEDPEACPDPNLACAPLFAQGMAPPGYEEAGVCVVPEGCGEDACITSLVGHDVHG